MIPAAYAILHVPTPEGHQARPAIAVWQVPDGLAWVEPNYLDGDPGDPPSFHRIPCQVRDYPGGLVLETEDGTGLAMALELAGEDPLLNPPELRRAFEAYQASISEKGLTREGEALRLEAELEYMLA